MGAFGGSSLGGTSDDLPPLELKVVLGGYLPDEEMMHVDYFWTSTVKLLLVEFCCLGVVSVYKLNVCVETRLEILWIPPRGGLQFVMLAWCLD